MCLSVYLGTSRALTIPSAAYGELGVEPAKWTPPPLKRNHAFVYYLGANVGDAKPLGCACLLMDHVEWTDGGPIVHIDKTFRTTTACPFATLRSLCEEATRDGGFATIVCDDSGGEAQDCSEDDYCTGGLIRLAMIAPGNLLFADAAGGFPWRVMHVVR